MELSTIQRLAALNQRFYAEHAENFADARPRLPVGVQRVLAGVAAGARVLEVGCGDGKVGRALARQGVAAYVGLDSSEAMLERAARYMMKDRFAGQTPLGGREQATNGAVEASVLRPAKRASVFLPADLTSPSWSGVIAGGSFDWILAFAVFHHLPGYDLRAGVLQTLAGHLAPGGRVALSNWQFTRSERLKKRIVAWATAGITEDDVEAGDYLLSWERKGTHGLRYVHVLDDLEARRIAAGVGLQVVETFSADGVTGDLSEYVVMKHAD
jgi:tRNA (uracil-5-)-methyltransferase TRM9